MTECESTETGGAAPRLADDDLVWLRWGKTKPGSDTNLVRLEGTRVKTRVALYEEPNERLIIRPAGSPTAFMVGLMPLALLALG